MALDLALSLYELRSSSIRNGSKNIPLSDTRQLIVLTIDSYFTIPEDEVLDFVPANCRNTASIMLKYYDPKTEIFVMRNNDLSRLRYNEY